MSYYSPRPDHDREEQREAAARGRNSINVESFALTHRRCLIFLSLLRLQTAVSPLLRLKSCEFPMNFDAGSFSGWMSALPLYVPPSSPSLPWFLPSKLRLLFRECTAIFYAPSHIIPHIRAQTAIDGALHRPSWKFAATK